MMMATDAAAEKAIKSFKLKGHKGPVTCLDHSSSIPSGNINAPLTTACLLSGSEDGSARVWDLRERLRASLCIKTPDSGEVLSVAFGPKWEDESKNDTTSIFSRDLSVYLATGSSVYGYDLRNASSPIIVEPTIKLPLDSGDEVNQISFSRSRQSRDLQLAAADDTGAVRVTDCITTSNRSQGSGPPRRRILLHSRATAPGQECLVTAAVFRPNSKAPLLASGGTDCTIHLWDITKPRNPLSSFSIENLDSGANQVCNPPMVNSMAWAPSGRLLGAALGDGSCVILSLKKDRYLNVTSRLEDAHAGAIASIVFPEWSNTPSGSTSSSNKVALSATDRLLATAGNDGIVLWDLGASICGDKATDPESFMILPDSDDDDDDDDKQQSESKDQTQPKTLFGWQHGSKPNWLVSSRGSDPVFPSTLFVADTSNDITAYTVPLK